MTHTDYVFVYGTLLKAADHPMHQLLARQCELIGQAHIIGQLYEVANYPAAIQSKEEDDRVLGELYHMLNADNVLGRLDDYEGCSAQFEAPHEYNRKIIDVYLADGSQSQAWAYIYNYDVSSLTHIESGDYLQFIAAK